MDKFEYNQVIRTTLHADAATGGFSVENDFLIYFANFTGKHLHWSVFLIKFVKALLKRDSDIGVSL